MTRQTENHDWTVPLAGNTNWASWFDSLFDTWDEHVIIRPDDEPTPTTEGLLYIDDIDRHPMLRYDTETSIVQPRAAQRWDVHDVAWKDRNQSISAQWRFDETITADITGNANRVDVADFAENATDSTALDDVPSSSWAASPADRIVTANWRFAGRTRFEDGLRASSGTIDLPVYDMAGDPTAVDTETETETDTDE